MNVYYYIISNRMWWLNVFVFFIILFSYIHVQQQFKSGEDLEIYEYDVTTVKALQDMLHVKQPVLFRLEFALGKNIEPLEFLEIKDRRDYNDDSKKHVESIQLSLASARRLMDTDTKGLFYSNRNRPNGSWKTWFRKMDTYLKPSFSLYTETDLIYGSKHARTTTSFHRESHTFLYVPPETNKGSIRVKMTVPKSHVFLNPVNDYTFFENWSAVDLFEPHEKIQCIDFYVKPGHVLFIPAFWFYSIEFQEKENEVCMVKYTTGANFIANIKHIGLFYMQQQNIAEKWWKPLQNVEFALAEEAAPDEPMIISDISQCHVPVVPEEKTVVQELLEELHA